MSIFVLMLNRRKRALNDYKPAGLCWVGDDCGCPGGPAHDGAAPRRLPPGPRQEVIGTVR